jgi:FkbM family methyltransferase
MGLEGLVSKRRDRRYSAGRSKDWIKVKNRTHPAMTRVMDAHKYNPGAGRLVADDTDLAKRVELWTGDHLFAVANIDRLDLVKIDVEGHEDAVFATCAGQFKKLRPRAIVFECTSGSCAPEGKIGALLNSIDYAVFGVRKRLTKLDLVPIKSASDCIFNDYVAMRK